jgi:hypothetical protein
MVIAVKLEAKLKFLMAATLPFIFYKKKRYNKIC